MKYIDTNRGYITAVELERLEVWESFYIELVHYHKQYGHCLINSKTHTQLAKWVASQRARKRQGVISGQEEDLLDDLGFVWKLKEGKALNSPRISWGEYSERFVLYIEKHTELSHEELYDRIKAEEKSLYDWLYSNRSKFFNDSLDDYKEEFITKYLGRVWYEKDKREIPHKSWVERYEELKVFYKKHKHCEVPKVYHSRHAFTHWYHNQIKKYKSNTLLVEKRRLLDEIGFEQAVYNTLTNDDKWMFRYEQLVAYKNTHGHIDIPYNEKSYVREWKRRQVIRKRALSKEQIELLDKLGVDWQLTLTPNRSKEGSHWYKRFEAYEHYVKEGKVDQIRKSSPKGSPEKSLYYWKTKQRSRYQIGYPFTEDQLQKLKENGVLEGLEEQETREDFVYTDLHQPVRADGRLNQGYIENEKRWEAKINELKLFKAKFGHCYVRQNEEGYKSLGTWVNKMRTLKKKNKLDLKREEQLNEIGFIWDLEAFHASRKK